MARTINVNDYLATVEDVNVVLGNETFPCKTLSFRDAVELQAKMQTMQKTPEDTTLVLDFLNDVCDRTGLPKDKMLALPSQVFLAVIVDFFASQTTGELKPSTTK